MRPLHYTPCRRGHTEGYGHQGRLQGPVHVSNTLHLRTPIVILTSAPWSIVAESWRLGHVPVVMHYRREDPC